MNRLDNFLRQHKDIMEEAKYIEEVLNKNEYRDFIGDLAIHISLLAGKLKVHLASEDRFLYPSLLESENEELKKMAGEYMSEMGHISETYTNYKNQFNTKFKISNDIDEFIKQSNNVIKAIKTRMAKEENGLYKLIGR